MVKNSIQDYNSPKSSDLSVDPNHEVNFLLGFIDRSISGFCPYYQAKRDSGRGADRENRITELLVFHLNLCLTEELSGYTPFEFIKNPTQNGSGSETDIGVFVKTRSANPVTMLECEAKRFSSTSNNKAYVCGPSGGIERFKKGDHAAHLSTCAMLGYVQSSGPEVWIKKVNNWISEQSKKNTDPDIDWTSLDEKLSIISRFPDVIKLRSEHGRLRSNDTILLWHYFINIC